MSVFLYNKQRGAWKSMKKYLCMIMVVVLIFTSLSMPAFCESTDSEKDIFIEKIVDAVRVIFKKGPRHEGKEATGLDTGGNEVYTVYPKISDEVANKLIEEKLQEVRSTCQEYSLEVLKEGFDDFKREISETAMFEWFPLYGTPKYVDLVYYSDNAFIDAEVKLENMKEEKEKNEQNNKYLSTWSKGMPSVWAREGVDEAIGSNYVPVSLQCNYQNIITREEFAELVVTAVFEEFNKGLEEIYKNNKKAWEFEKLTVENFLTKVSSTQKFSDTNNDFVTAANILGIVNGSDGKFNPKGEITREQVAVMILNYIQTCHTLIDSRLENSFAEREMADFNKISSWAKEAVIRVYSPDIMKGTVAPVESDDGEIVKKGTFDSKGKLTREQAILIVLNMLNHIDLYGSSQTLKLRGYVPVTMDMLMSGFVIDGDTVKMKRSGYDNKVYSIETYMFCADALTKTSYILKYDSEIIDSISLGGYISSYVKTKSEMEKVVSGKQTYYDYGIFTVEHNKNGYLVVVSKSKNSGYFCGDHYYKNDKNVEIELINKPTAAEGLIITKSSFTDSALKQKEINTFVNNDSGYPQQQSYKNKSGKWIYPAATPLGVTVGYAIKMNKEAYLNGKKISVFSIGGKEAIFLDELKDFGYEYKKITDKRLEEYGQIQIYRPKAEILKEYNKNDKVKGKEGNAIYTLVSDEYCIVIWDKDKGERIGSGLKSFVASSGERFILVDELWNDNMFYRNKYGYTETRAEVFNLEGNIYGPVYLSNNDLAIVERGSKGSIDIHLLSISESRKYYTSGSDERIYFIAQSYPTLCNDILSPRKLEAWKVAGDIVSSSVKSDMTETEKAAALKAALDEHGYYYDGGMTQYNCHDEYQALVEKFANYHGWYDAYKMVLARAGIDVFPEYGNEDCEDDYSNNGYLTGVISAKLDGVWQYIEFLPPEYKIPGIEN